MVEVLIVFHGNCLDSIPYDRGRAASGLQHASAWYVTQPQDTLPLPRCDSSRCVLQSVATTVRHFCKNDMGIVCHPLALLGAYQPPASLAALQNEMIASVFYCLMLFTPAILLSMNDGFCKKGCAQALHLAGVGG